ncbi:hypothetical protein V8G54_019942, partial [Vigna mungo]
KYASQTTDSTHIDAMNLSYEQKLQVVAKIILNDEARAGDAPPCEEELGLRATLKPHQVEGVSWLIRRYKLGVNVVLGETVTLSMCFIALNVSECERNYGGVLFFCMLFHFQTFFGGKIMNSEIVRFNLRFNVFVCIEILRV